MAEAVSITAEARDPAKNKGTGSRVARRLRKQGRVPAIVYGHKQDPQPISIARDDVLRMVKQSTHLAQLAIGSASEMVLVKAVQWDHLGKDIIHLDFARVSADESIQTTVPLHVHGTAPGVAEGGNLEILVHEVLVTCRATAIPAEIRVEVGDLHLHQGVHVRDLKLPEGVTVVADADLLLLHVAVRYAAPEPTVVEPATTEPEVIGRKAEDKEKEEKEKKG